MIEQEQFNFAEEKPMTELTINEFKAICKNLFDIRTEFEEIERIYKVKSKELEDAKYKVLAYMEEYKLPSFEVPGMGTIGTRNTFQVKMPQETDKREILLAYIRESGLENTLTINHNTLNKLYNDKRKEVEEQGGSLEGLIPGLDDPRVHTILTIRKGK